MSFMEDYHQGTLEILALLGDELDHIAELASRAAGIVRVGGTLWTSMDLGHMPVYEQATERRGNPHLLRNHRDFDPLIKGDMVFTHRCNREVQAARQRGVYVVCVTSNYQDNEFRPLGFTDLSHSNPDGLMLKDVSNAILHSHVPYTQGLVRVPEIPEFTICPSSTTGSGTVHWLLNAEIASRLANPGAQGTGKGAEYLRVLTERVEGIKGYADRIIETAAIMSDRVLAGGRWFARSIEHPGFETEFNVASGPRMVNWGDWPATTENNILLISAISPAYPEEMELARQKRTEEAYTIGIGPSSLDGHVPAERLIDMVDVGFDNLSPEFGGVIEVSGREGAICPTSGIVGNVIQQMITAQWAEEMIHRGAVPTFMRGVYQAGGREYNDAMQPVFERRGY
jgi:hypothetical protein